MYAMFYVCDIFSWHFFFFQKCVSSFIFLMENVIFKYEEVTYIVGKCIKTILCKIFIFRRAVSGFPPIFSSPGHKVLKVGYCRPSLSVVPRQHLHLSDISSKTVLSFSMKLDRNDCQRVFDKKKCYTTLHKIAARAWNRKKL